MSTDIYIFHKNRVQTVILRSWKCSYLHWHKNYNIKRKFMISSPVANLMHHPLLLRNCANVICERPRTIPQLTSAESNMKFWGIEERAKHCFKNRMDYSRSCLIKHIIFFIFLSRKCYWIGVQICCYSRGWGSMVPQQKGIGWNSTYQGWKPSRYAYVLQHCKDFKCFQKGWR